MFFTSLWCKTYQTKYFLWSNQESAAGSNSFSKSYIEKGKGMCSPFQLQKVMENNFQGDLADIFRGSSTSSGESSSTIIADGWQFPSHPINYLASGVEEPFGDPFCNLRDPLFHDIYLMPIEDNNNNSTSLEEPEIKRGNNIFSRMLQISPTTKSPCDSPMAAAVTCSSPFVANDAIISPNSSKTRLVENSRLQLQISSPPNTAIKRRKCQAKKVVCIPAPAPANSRQGGEVVPSDLWAWRKYGQKPIKGSPYPRGYYRCSSSKGCSARKQVERSRTDPNMLVITYTSEHNHPWPTQRNALAGSTRSQPTNSKHTSKSPTNTSFKEDEKKESNINDKNTSSIVAQVNLKVKEEVALEDLHGHHQQLVKMHDVEFSKGIQDSYQPVLPEDSSNQCHEDFFSDLVELEADPLNLLFAKTLSGDINEVGQKKAIDAFNLYEWSGNSNKDGNTTSNNKGQADA